MAATGWEAVVETLLAFTAKKSIDILGPHSLQFFVKLSIKAAIIWFLALLCLPANLSQIVGSRFGQAFLLFACFHEAEDITTRNDRKGVVSGH